MLSEGPEGRGGEGSGKSVMARLVEGRLLGNRVGMGLFFFLPRCFFAGKLHRFEASLVFFFFLLIGGGLGCFSFLPFFYFFLFVFFRQSIPDFVFWCLFWGFGFHYPPVVVFGGIGRPTVWVKGV